MRYGILSDIHANLLAFEAVLAHLEGARIDAFLILGDLVGYGADPNACCDKARALPGLRVRGNHDSAVLSHRSLECYHPLARQAVRWTARTLTMANRAFLASLPLTARGDGFQVAHGSLTDPEADYITDPFSASACLDLQEERVCFVGHTHVPAVFARPQSARSCSAVPFRPNSPVRLEPHLSYVINCGAVGQPRDRNPDAACGIFDTETRTVELARVPYDVAGAQERIRAAGLPEPLAERLRSGY